MKEIKLNRGFSAKVDDEDYDFLNQWKWYAFTNKYTFYAVRQPSRKEGPRKLIFMHRIIINTPENLEVDHIDHNGLNNQKINLRNCTRGQNQKNRINKKVFSSPYKGVFYDRKYIRSVIYLKHKAIHLGTFKTEESAALAYNKAAIQYHKKFANLNIIKS